MVNVMGVIKAARDSLKLFAYEVWNIGTKQRVVSPADRPVAGKRIVVKIVDFLQRLSNWSDLQDEEIQEQLYVWDPEIGGALDRQSTLVAQSFQGPMLRDKDKTEDKLELDMLKQAKKTCDDMRMADQFETYGEMLPLFGDVYIDIRDPMTYRIIPNRFVTLIESREQLHLITVGLLLTQGNYLVFNEFLPGEFILGPGEFVHLKYKNTPIYALDKKGRWTYGMYSVSPVSRAILSAWQGRVLTIIDILHRWRIIPREVHSVNSELFALDQYNQATGVQRLATSQTEANKYISAYNTAIQDQAPDQGYTVLDTITISMLESKNSTYMQTNEAIDQLDSKKWVALNMPKSVVTGDGAGSYASELVISNYVSAKAVQLANKIKPFLLDNLRKRLATINAKFPVDELDIKIELSMAATRLETFHEMAIMGSLDSFTRTEIRARLGYQPLLESQMGDVVMSSMRTHDEAAAERDAQAKIAQHPETPQSKDDHMQPKGAQVVNKAQNG
jgi:hypothetical protein